MLPYKRVHKIYPPAVRTHLHSFIIVCADAGEGSNMWEETAEESAVSVELTSSSETCSCFVFVLFEIN